MARVLLLLAVLRCCWWTDARLVFSGYGKNTGCTELTVYIDTAKPSYTSYAIASSGTVLRVTKLVGAQAPPTPMDWALSHVIDIPVADLSLSPPLVDVMVNPNNEVVAMDRTGNSRHIVPNSDVTAPNMTDSTSRLGSPLGGDTCVSCTSRMVGGKSYTFACCNTLFITWRTAGGSFFAKEIAYKCEKLVVSGDGFVFGTPRDRKSDPIYFNASADNLASNKVAHYFMPVPLAGAISQGIDVNADGRVVILYRPPSTDTRYLAVASVQDDLSVATVLLEAPRDPAGLASGVFSGFATDSRHAKYSYYTTIAFTFASGFRNVATMERVGTSAAFESGATVTGLPHINANKGIFSAGEYLFVCTDSYQLLFTHSFAPLPATATVTAAEDTLTVTEQDAVDTSVPETALPATPLPDTDTPLTLGPGTTSEPTSIPTDAPTSAPTSIPTGTPTSVPTGVPATGVPGTAVPSQPAVATADTPVPAVPAVVTADTPLPAVPATTPPPALPEVEQIATAGGIAAVGSALGGGGGAATRLVIASLGCHKEGEPPPSVPLALHPTQIQVMGSDSAGAVVGNTLIAVGFGCVCAVALLILQRFGRSMCPGLFTSLDTQGFLRLPSAPFFVFQLLYQGTTYGAMNLVLHPPSVGLCIAGLVSLLLCIVLPLLVFWTVTSNVPRSAQYMHDTRPLGAWMTILIGPGEWVSLHEDCHWVNRYATAVRMYRQELAWFSIIEFAGSFALSALSAVDATTLVSCGHVKISAALVFLIMLVVEARLWPHARMRDSAMDFVGLGLQMSAMVLMGAGYYSGARDASDSWTFSGAGYILLLAVALVLLKVALDVISELYILLTGRRAALQQRAFWRRRDAVLQMQRFRSVARFSLPKSDDACTALFDGPEQDQEQAPCLIRHDPWSSPLPQSQGTILL